jgi:hypothetical protein
METGSDDGHSDNNWLRIVHSKMMNGPKCWLQLALFQSDLCMSLVCLLHKQVLVCFTENVHLIKFCNLCLKLSSLVCGINTEAYG